MKYQLAAILLAAAAGWGCGDNGAECGTGTMQRRTMPVAKELRGVLLTFSATVDVCDRCGRWEVPISEAGRFGTALEAARTARSCNTVGEAPGKREGRRERTPSVS